jgi:hypothetical protein
MCRLTDRAIHECFPNKDTVDSLMADDQMRRMVRFIAKQDPGGRVKFNGKCRKWGRNG